jgi:hypothetical protein
VTDRSRIDADLDGVRLSPDGSRLILLLRDGTGQKVSLSLPTSCLNTVLTAAPSPLDTGTVQSVDAWNMVPAGNGQDMVLTLCTPEGRAISFRIKSWHAEGIATVAAYGSTRGRTSRSIH